MRVSEAITPRRTKANQAMNTTTTTNWESYEAAMHWLRPLPSNAYEAALAEAESAFKVAELEGATDAELEAVEVACDALHAARAARAAAAVRAD